MLTFEEVYDQLQVGDEFVFHEGPLVPKTAIWYILVSKSAETFTIAQADARYVQHNGLVRRVFANNPVVIRYNSPSDILFSYVNGGTISQEQLEKVKDHISAEISKS